MAMNALRLNKRLPGVLIAVSAAIVLTTCSQFPLERPSEVGYIGFNVEVRNMPSFINVDRVYVLDENGAQIGPGGPAPARGQVQALQIPEIYQGKPVYVCMGHSVLTYTRTMAAIEGGETIIISGEDVNVGLPENLPEVPGFTSSNTVEVSDGGGIGSAFTVKSIFVTSFEGLHISAAAFDEVAQKWTLVLVDAFDGQKLRFWTKFEAGGETYYFYNDQVWNKGADTTISVTYKGKPLISRADIEGLGIAQPGHYVLVSAQYLTGAWSPIALPTGVILHGGGSVIRNLTFDTNQTGMTGFFSTVNGNIYDLRLELAQTAMISIQQGDSAGVLAGIIGGNAEVKNVSVTASGATANVRWRIRGRGDSNIGGLCGKLVFNAVIERCAANIKVELDVDSLGGDYFVGGLAGYSDSPTQILDSYALGDVLVQNNVSAGLRVAGGLAGRANGSVTRTYAAGSILGNGNNAKMNVGGVVGMATTLSRSAALGERVYAGSTESDRSAGPVVGGNTNIQPGVTYVYYQPNIQVQCSTVNNLGTSTALNTWGAWTTVFQDTSAWMWNAAVSRPKLVWQVNSDDLSSGILDNLPPGLVGLFPGGSFPTGIP